MDNYFIIDAQQQSRQNKKNNAARVALLAVLIVGMVGTIAFFTESSNPSSNLIIPNMTYLSQSSRDVVITSQRNMTVCTSQKAEHQPTTQEQCTVYSSTQDIIAAHNGDDKIVAHIVYRDLQSLSQFNPQGNMIPDEDSFSEVSNGEVSLIFKATISTEGTLLKLEQPKGNPVSQIAIRLTERLIEQYFPQLNSTLYTSNNSSSSSNLLRASNDGSSEQIVEETYLGQVSPNYTFDILPQGDIILSKSYNSESFTNFAYSLGGKMPNIQFESNFFVRNGQVEQNTEIMVFNITHSHEDILLSSDNNIPINNSTEYEELVGQAFTRIESNFQLISTGYNQTLVAEIDNYENTHSFEQVNLEETGGKLKIIKNKIQQVGEKLLSEGTETPLIDKKFDVFRKQIVGNTLALTIEYQNFENYSLIQSAIYLNGQKVFNIYGKRVEHPWYACEAQSMSDKGSLKKTVFQVIYPLLGGVINIPITANIELEYGWQFTTSKDEQGLCTLEFHPFAKPTLGVEGSIAVWKVAEGGVFAKGSVANLYLDFLLQLDRSNLQALLSVDAHLIPFEYKMGAFYSYIKCNIKNIKEKILQFKWKEICWKTPREEIVLLEGSLLSPLNYNLYTETCPLLKPSTL